MSDLDGLINLIPIGDIAKKLGIDENIARAAVAVAVPAIVGGLAANAANADGAKKLESALGHHDKAVTSLDEVDEADGEKIVKHVFGSKTGDVAAAAGAKAGGPDIGAIVAQVLPIIAPIVLSFVASQFLGGKKAEPAAAEPVSNGTDIGSLLGGLLASKQGQDLIGGALSGLLGGGTK
ncbi:MAG: DUF937 domain-containing protein [Rhodoglobus sp.]